MKRIECPTCQDCLTSDWTGPKCSECGGSGHVKVRDEEEEAHEEDSWEAQREWQQTQQAESER
jgi:hypothetical protein